MSRSSATSLMVRNASGALSKGPLLYLCFGITIAGSDIRILLPGSLRTSIPQLAGLALAVAGVVAIYTLLQNGRWLEHHHAARRDRHLGAGLRIASDPLTFLAHHERAERRELHRLALLKAVGNLLQYKLYKCR